MSRRRAWGWSLLFMSPAVMLLSMMLAFVYPGNAFFTELSGVIAPLVLVGLVWSGTHLRPAEKKKKEEFPPSMPPMTELPPSGQQDKYARLDRMRRDIQRELRSGMITADDARDRWREAALLFTADRKSPAEQTRELAAKYGLPVVTELKKDAPLPLVTAPPVSGAGLGPAQLADLRRRLEESKGKPPVILPATTESFERNMEEFMAARELDEPEETEPPEEPYVPAGQAELEAELNASLRRQWKDAEPDRRGQSIPYDGYWHMSPEWAAEVRKLRAPSGHLVWKPDRYTLYGYLVKIDRAYGAPEIVREEGKG